MTTEEQPRRSPLVPRPGIERIQRYVQGQSVVAAGRSIKLSANESALGPSPKAIAAYHAAAAEVARYPEASGLAIRNALASRHGLDASRILMGIGSDELLAALVRAYAGPGDQVLFPTATFPMYRIYALAAGADPVRAADKDFGADIDALLAAVTPATKVVILANPNNPTGTYTARSALERLRAGLRDDILLVVDAAYAEYVERPDYDPGATLAHVTPNTVMTRTFSKVHGLASLRLGWMYADAEIVGVVGRIRSPFNVSTAAQVAGLAAIEDTAWQSQVIAHTRRWRETARQRLLGLGLTVTGTEANFVNCGFPDADAYLRSQGISVRPMAAFGLPNHLRITIGTDAEMTACLDAVAAFVGGARA
jgi:histidinol-phosphate aminotransferase